MHHHVCHQHEVVFRGILFYPQPPTLCQSLEIYYSIICILTCWGKQHIYMCASQWIGSSTFGSIFIAYKISIAINSRTWPTRREIRRKLCHQTQDKLYICWNCCRMSERTQNRNDEDKLLRGKLHRINIITIATVSASN